MVRTQKEKIRTTQRRQPGTVVVISNRDTPYFQVILPDRLLEESPFWASPVRYIGGCLGQCKILQEIGCPFGCEETRAADAATETIDIETVIGPQVFSTRISIFTRTWSRLAHTRHFHRRDGGHLRIEIISCVCRFEICKIPVQVQVDWQ